MQKKKITKKENCQLSLIKSSTKHVSRKPGDRVYRKEYKLENIIRNWNV